MFPSRPRILAPAASLPGIVLSAFAVRFGLVSGYRPLADPAPYLRGTAPKAAPKCISGRTSYLRVRLAFHLYPQLIPRFCNTGGFGPPRGFTRASPWPWIAHASVSGPIRATARPVQTRFRCGCRYEPLSLATQIDSPVRSTKSTPSGFPPPTACKRTVSGSVSLPSPGFFSPFPHGTGALSVTWGI